MLRAAIVCFCAVVLSLAWLSPYVGFVAKLVITVVVSVMGVAGMLIPHVFRRDAIKKQHMESGSPGGATLGTPTSIQSQATAAARQPQTEPQRRGRIRRLLGGICVFATLFSAFFTGTGILMSLQLVDDDIPAGKIEAITRLSKGGPRLRLDTGREAVFPGQVLSQQAKPIELSIGDHVEKRRGSIVYVVNGTAVTGFRWMLWNCLLPVPALIPLAIYLLVGGGYVLAYKRTPIGDRIWSDEEDRPRRPRTRAGMMAALLVSWLAATLLMTVLFGCISGCLFGIGREMFG
jgi:hypothetical protein